jgi:RimJ/RimL family protein N-acetyltransferase
MIRLVPWSEDDLHLAERFLGDSRMMVHLGGRQAPDAIQKAHGRWLNVGRAGTGEMFKVVAGEEIVGQVGYWEKDWHGEPIFEAGWSIFPQYQGRGLALEATLAIIERARARGTRRSLHAFPHVDNEASNAICGKAGFTLIGPVEFEYPPGNFEMSNDWSIALL